MKEIGIKATKYFAFTFLIIKCIYFSVTIISAGKDYLNRNSGLLLARETGATSLRVIGSVC